MARIQHSSSFGWGSQALAAEKNFGPILPTTEGNFRFVALIGTANSSVTADQSPFVQWGHGLLLFFGSVSFNGCDILLYGGTPGPGLVGFKCVPGTAFSGTICTWEIEGSPVPGPLQTATGTDRNATIDLTGEAGSATFVMAFSTTGTGLVGTPGYGWPPAATISDPEARRPTVTLVTGDMPSMQRASGGSSANLGHTAVMLNYTSPGAITLDWPLASDQPWAILAQPIG